MDIYNSIRGYIFTTKTVADELVYCLLRSCYINANGNCFNTGASELNKNLSQLFQTLLLLTCYHLLVRGGPAILIFQALVYVLISEKDVFPFFEATCSWTLRCFTLLFDFLINSGPPRELRPAGYGLA